ncbi:MAG: hypothetical protein RIC87_03380 [Kiloniellales bacterium]
MTTTQQPNAEDRSLGRDLLFALRYHLSGRRGLLVLAGLAIVAGLALNWGWLAAAGIAPILIGVLPCLAMCALGLCMNRAGGKSCSTTASNSDPATLGGAGSVTKAVALDGPPDRASPEQPISGDAAVLAIPDPQPSKGRRPTHA